MNHLTSTIIVVALVFASGCTDKVMDNAAPDNLPEFDSDGIFIRVKNDNSFSLQNLTIGNLEYGTVSAGDISKFNDFQGLESETLRVAFDENAMARRLNVRPDSALKPGFFDLRLYKIHTGEFKNALRFAFGFPDSAHTYDREKANVRVLNESGTILRNVVISGVNYGTLDPDEVSSYKSFDAIFRNAYIELYIGDTFFSAQPVDHVGETPLGSGFYTFKLRVNEAARFVISEVLVE